MRWSPSGPRNSRPPARRCGSGGRPSPPRTRRARCRRVVRPGLRPAHRVPGADGLGDESPAGADPGRHGGQRGGGPHRRTCPANPAARCRTRPRSGRCCPGRTGPGRAYRSGEDQGDGVRGLPPRARRAPGGCGALLGGPGDRGSSRTAEPGDARTQPPRVPPRLTSSRTMRRPRSSRPVSSAARPRRPRPPPCAVPVPSEPSPSCHTLHRQPLKWHEPPP